MENIFSINHTALSVNDINRSIEFYEFFGFKKEKEYHDDALDIVTLRLGETKLELFHYKEHIDLPEHCKELSTDLKTIGTKHLGLGVEDIETAKRQIEISGIFDGEIKIVSGRLGKPYFFIKDPDGILLEIIEK